MPPSPTRVSRATTFIALALLAGAGGTCPAARAHGDDAVLIEALSEEIARKPDPDLLLRRGELHRHHQDWVKAAADYDAAARLAPELKLIDYFRGRMLLEAGDAAKARGFADRYVANAPDEPEAHFLQGDVHAALGQPDAGAESYADGIRRSPRPRPEHYLRRAELLGLASPGDEAAMLAVLDEGIARLGPVLSLIDKAIALDLAAKNFGRALARIAVALEHSPRRETWLVRRGDVLVASGRREEAAAAYRDALAAIDGLPERYRSTVPIEKLTRDARSALQRLAGGAPPIESR